MARSHCTFQTQFTTRAKRRQSLRPTLTHPKMAVPNAVRLQLPNLTMLIRAIRQLDVADCMIQIHVKTSRVNQVERQLGIPIAS